MAACRDGMRPWSARFPIQLGSRGLHLGPSLTCRHALKRMGKRTAKLGDSIVTNSGCGRVWLVPPNVTATPPRLWLGLSAPIRRRPTSSCRGRTNASGPAPIRTPIQLRWRAPSPTRNAPSIPHRRASLVHPRVRRPLQEPNGPLPMGHSSRFVHRPPPMRKSGRGPGQSARRQGFFSSHNGVVGGSRQT